MKTHESVHLPDCYLYTLYLVYYLTGMSSVLLYIIVHDKTAAEDKMT